MGRAKEEIGGCAAPFHIADHKHEQLAQKVGPVVVGLARTGTGLAYRMIDIDLGVWGGSGGDAKVNGTQFLMNSWYFE